MLLMVVMSWARESIEVIYQCRCRLLYWSISPVSCCICIAPIFNVTGNQPWYTKENPPMVHTFSRGDQVSFWVSHVPQVFQSTKTYSRWSGRWGCLWPILDPGMGRMGSISPLFLCGHCYCPCRSNTTCTMSASMAVSSSLIQCIAPHLLSLFDWQTLLKWFCLPYALHVWPHPGHICDLSPDPAPQCWWLLQPLHAFWGVSFSSLSFCVCWFWSIGLRFGPAFVGDSLTSEALLCPRHWIFCLDLAWLFQMLWCGLYSALGSSATLLWPAYLPAEHHELCPGWTGTLYKCWADCDYCWGIWSYNSVPLTAAELSNFIWTHYCFEQSMKIRSGEPWDLTSVRLGPRALVGQGLCWKIQDMYWWWNSGRLP